MPIDWGQQMIESHFQLQPSVVKGPMNAAVETEKRYLYTKLYSLYDLKLPKEWHKNLFRMFVFRYGSIAVIYTKKFGWIFWPYGVTKVGLYYLPSEIEVWNGHLPKAQKGIIGVNAEIVKVMDDYRGLDDLVTKYAVQLAQIDKSVGINFMNANVSLYAEAKNKKDADDIYTAYATATEGKPMVLMNKELMEGRQLKTLIQNPKSEFMALEMLQARRDITNLFLTDIGIPTANYEKRAQISTAEVEQRDGETNAICSIILENLKECFEKVNAISDLGLEVDFRKEVKEVLSDSGGKRGDENG